MVKGMITLFRIISFTGPYKKHFLLGLLLIGADVSFNVGIIAAIQSVTDSVLTKDLKTTYKLLILIFLCLLVCILLSILGASLRKYASVQANKRLTDSLLMKVNSISFKHIQQYHTGDLVERINLDVGRASEVLNGDLVVLISKILICISSFLFLSNINLVLALIAISTGPITFIAGRLFDHKIRTTSENLNNTSGRFRGLLQEFLQSMLVIRALGITNVFEDKLLEVKEKQEVLFRKKTILNVSMWRVIVIVNNLVSILLTYIIAEASIKGTMPIGAVLSFLFLMGKLQWPFINISSTWGNIQNAFGSADRVFKILDLHSDLYEANVEELDLDENNNLSEDAVIINNLSFSYDDKQIFKGLNLKIKKGEVVAIIGPSGSGKSTLAKLCCGLFSPEVGDIRIFGQSIKSNLNQARKLVAYVPQTPYVFTGTIEDNILYGLNPGEKPKEDTAYKASVMANAHEFITKLSNGYKTKLKEHGSSLSGGQRQRLTIARALAKNAELLIFDEATSALDNESEQLIKQTTDSLLGKKTMIIIAHRLTTVKDASRIIVLKKGKVVEEGNHNELLERRGAYFKLYSKID